jgi:hypothetical protein
LEIWNTDQLTIKADNDAEILLIEVPMQIWMKTQEIRRKKGDL